MVDELWNIFVYIALGTIMICAFYGGTAYFVVETPKLFFVSAVISYISFFFFPVYFAISMLYREYTKASVFVNEQDYETCKIDTLALCLRRTPLKEHKGIRLMILDYYIATKIHGEKCAFHICDENGVKYLIKYARYWEKYDAWVFIDNNGNYEWALELNTEFEKFTCVYCNRTVFCFLCRGCFKQTCVECLRIPQIRVPESEWDKPWPLEKDGTCPYHR